MLWIQQRRGFRRKPAGFDVPGPELRRPSGVGCAGGSGILQKSGQRNALV